MKYKDCMECGHEMQTIAIEWQDNPLSGSIRVVSGELSKLDVARGSGSIECERFELGQGGCRIDISVKDEDVSFGAAPTIIEVDAGANSFAFFLRDVSSKYPILIREYGVVVTEQGDHRSYPQIESAISARGLKAGLETFELEDEESYDNAAAHTRSMRCPTWLGVGRDIRIFEVKFGFEEPMHAIVPRLHGDIVKLPEMDGDTAAYYFMMGRGIGCIDNITRHLENDVLPILHAEVLDCDVRYDFTSFTSLETSPLTAESVQGTHYLVADSHSIGRVFTEQHTAQLASVEQKCDEETVLYSRVTATNMGNVPRYAWLKAAVPNVKFKVKFDGATGFGAFESGRVFTVVKLNGKPLIKDEVAILLQPGETATLEFAIPNSPISEDRAHNLSGQLFEDRLSECRAFWMEKLKSAGQISLPESRVDEMVRAGLLHLDLISYGKEPYGAVSATVGVYSAIGSESAPIIQYMDSVGWHDLAERMIMYFLETQQDDGFIQNFGGYMLETGPALWTIGEHYRYTHDTDWAIRVMPKVLKSVDYLLKWRDRNKLEQPGKAGYGMLDGKVADPEDPFRSYMLNGYAYLGLIRVAEMLADVDPDKACELKKEAMAFREDIRSAFFNNLAKSPVVPLGDGSWCPTVPPWAEAQSPCALLASSDRVFTHGTFMCRDALTGPHYLALQEVIDPKEQASTFMLRYITELFSMRNVGFSQPYYSPHPWMHLKRGETKAFLKEYYNGFSGLADRETYTFWEHYHHESPHKTHEESWFLMQTRWMLYMEEGQTLNLLPSIPRAWMEHGQSIVVDKMCSYFGEFSMRVESQAGHGRIEASVECETDYRPGCVKIRLPHPQGLTAKSVVGGEYDPECETVSVESFTGRAHIVLEF